MFIDDNLANVQAAFTLGFVGIQMKESVGTLIRSLPPTTWPCADLRDPKQLLPEMLWQELFCCFRNYFFS